MDVNRCLIRSRRIMDSHGLINWSICLNSSKTIAGQCDYNNKTIWFSRHFIYSVQWKTFKETLLHEIAHALKPYHGHDRVWRSFLQSIGGTPSVHADQFFPCRWIRFCDSCKWTEAVHNRTNVHCQKCLQAVSYKQNRIEKDRGPQFWR